MRRQETPVSGKKQRRAIQRCPGLLDDANLKKDGILLGHETELVVFGGWHGDGIVIVSSVPFPSWTDAHPCP